MIVENVILGRLGGHDVVGGCQKQEEACTAAASTVGVVRDELPLVSSCLMRPADRCPCI